MQRRRNYAGDDGLIEIGKIQFLDFEQLRQPHRIFVGRARGFGRGTPLDADFALFTHGEDDIGIADIDCE